MAYDASLVSDSVIAHKKGLTLQLLRGLRDNGIAIAEADASVPAALLPTVLLGTLTTTSGSSVSLTSLDLTPYKFVRFVFDGVSTVGSNVIRVGGESVVGDATNNSATWRGIVDIDLATGVGIGVIGNISGGGSTAATEVRVLETGLSTASTSLTVSVNAGSFDAGQVKVYGMK